MIQECINWLRKAIFYLCGIQANILTKILHLDLPGIERRNKDTLCVVISCYISTVWFNRSDLRFIKNIVKANIIKMQKFHMIMLGTKKEKVFSDNYCNLDMRILNSL